MTNDDVLYTYRLRVLATAYELGSVAAACRVHGFHRSTYYRWKGMVDRFGLEILRPRERRAQHRRLLAWTSGPAAISDELARERNGGFRVSPSGVPDL